MHKQAVKVENQVNVHNKLDPDIDIMSTVRCTECGAASCINLEDGEESCHNCRSKSLVPFDGF